MLFKQLIVVWSDDPHQLDAVVAAAVDAIRSSDNVVGFDLAATAVADPANDPYYGPCVAAAFGTEAEVVLPRYKHDCHSCTFLGQFGKNDLYHCWLSGRHTVIARWNDDPPSYTSGLPFVGQMDPLTEAGRRAVAKGLLPPDKKLGDATGQTVAERLSQVDAERTEQAFNGSTTKAG